MKKLGLILSALLMSSSAFADICDYMTYDDAQKVLSIVTAGSTLIGDSSFQPTAVEWAMAVKRDTLGTTDYYQVMVNGTALDFGYTSLKLNDKVHLNIARLINCNGSGSITADHMIIPTSLNPDKAK